jgi:hypothetical protein
LIDTATVASTPQPTPNVSEKRIVGLTAPF